MTARLINDLDCKTCTYVAKVKIYRCVEDRWRRHGWVLHVQCAVAGQKQSLKNPEFRCSVLCVAESVTSYFTLFVCWHLPKTHNNSRKQRN